MISVNINNFINLLRLPRPTSFRSNIFSSVRKGAQTPCTLFKLQEPKVSFVVFQSEKDSKEEILKAFKLFDDDNTVSSTFILHFVILLFETRKK